MGQQEAKVSKNNKSNPDEFITMEAPPSTLRSFAGVLRSQEPAKITPRKFILKKDTETEFIITTNKDVGDLSSYQGFLEVHQGTSRVFAGWVANLRREGFGMEFDPSGRVFYRGEFANDLYHGWGSTPRYKGEFRRGKKEGWGIWDDHERGITYEGSFKEDKFDGIGYLNLFANEVQAFMTQDKPLEPAGKITRKYAGEWVNGRMQGSGKLTTVLEVYRGGFLDGQYSGEGILWKEGKTSEGKFYKGAPV